MGKLWAKYTNMSIQAKAAIWFAICNIFQKGISFITVPLFTRLLTPEQYGTYSLYLSWLQILTIITSLYLYQGVFNNGMTKFAKDRDAYISSMQGLTLTITIIVFVFYMITHKLWNELLGLTPIFMVMMFIEMSVTPALNFWSGKQRFEFRYKRLVAVTLAKSISNPILGLIMVLLAQQKDVARVVSVVITEVIFCGFIMVYQFIRGKKFIDLNYWKYALGLAVPLLPHYLSGMILNQGDRVMIDHMVGKSEVAFYSVAYNIGLLVQIFTHAINNSFIPWMYLKIKENDYLSIRRIVNILLLIIAIIGICLMMCSPELVFILGSEKYASAVYVISPVAASVFFIFLYNVLAIPQFYFERTKFLAISSFTSAILNIVLNYIFIKMFGFIAAGYTTLACYVFYSFGHYIVSKHVLKEYLHEVELYDKYFILALSIFIIIIGVGCNFIFKFWYIRYGLLVLILIATYIKRSEIINMIKGIRKQ